MKFRLKITCCMIILMALCFGAGSSVLISTSFKNSLRQEKQSARKSYRMVLNTLQVVNNLDQLSDKNDISKILEQLSSRGTFWAALQLHTVSDTLYSQGTAAPYFVDLGSRTDNTHLAGTIFTVPDTTCYLQLSGSFSVGKTEFLLDIAYDISSIYETRLQQQHTYRQVFIGLLVTCAFFSYILAYFLTRPLARLSRASREIACGNYDYRSNIQSSDEVSAVSRDFDLMAEHLQDSIEELHETMEQQNLFIENFTHELKTPMTSIIGYADLLRSQTLSPQDQADAAGYIFSEGKRLEHLSLKLLDIFVSEHTNHLFTEVSPADIIADFVSHLQPGLAPEKIDLTYECESGRCRLDTDLFGSLLVNLIENARKALPEGGCILVGSVMTAAGCRLTVQDNGGGIPAKALSHITEAFYRVDKARSRAQGGAGLGLTLCKKIAELHHGTITFESMENSGTTVTVELNGGRA